MKVKHEFKPIYDNKSKILILGTMPSIKSRANKFYYSNPTNRFFKIMETLFNTKLLNSDDKKAFLLKNKIALWDVCKECDILASSDSSIKNIIPNDISIILNSAPIKAIFTTGKTAYKLYQKYIFPNTKIEAISLPSSSSANASYSLNKLINEYQIILKFLE